MNAKRKTELNDICEKIKTVNSALESLCVDEEVYLEYLSEDLFVSEKYENTQACIEDMQEAGSNLKTAFELIKDIVNEE